jgi:hypothetical protein
MPAPLFGTTSASIKGLHLRDVVLVSNDNPIVGGLVCVLNATDDIIPVVEHCSVSGTFTIENTNYVPNNTHSDLEMNYAGVVAQSHGALINNCVSDVAITVKQIAKMGNTIKIRPYIGGIVGNAYSASLTNGYIYTHLNGCVNKGDLLYKDVCCQADNLIISPSVGGIAAGLHHHTVLASNANKISNYGATFANCTNYGDVTLQANCGGYSGDTHTVVLVHAAGIVARAAYTSLTDCDNYGAIKLDGKFTQTFSGGICGASWYTSLENCDNFGAVDVTETTTFRGIMLAGITGNNYSEANLTYSTKNCSNNAPITCLGSTDPTTPAASVFHYRIGGCEGFGRSKVEGLTNNKEGVVTCKGKVIYLTKASYYCNVGGVTAYRTTNVWTKIFNYAPVNIDIEFSIHKDVADDTTKVIDRSFFIGGIVGYSTQAATHSQNHGNVNVKGHYSGERLYIGGIVGYGTANYNQNYGEINVNATSTTTHTFIGGLFGGNDGTSAREEILNKGVVNVEGSYAIVAVGGIGGQNRMPMNAAKNEAAVNVKASASSHITAGGLFGYHVRHFYKDAKSGIVMEGGNGPLIDCVNNGKVTVEGVNSGGAAYVGGITRQGQNDMIGCINNGEIEVKGSFKGTIYVGGLITVNSACLREDCVNNGNINVSANAGDSTSTGSDAFLGGLCYSGGSNTTYRRCVNNGDITFTGKAANCARFGGLIANIETKDKTNNIEYCENHGDITMSGTGSAYAGGTQRFGGFCSQFTNGTVKIVGGFKNTGNITYAGTQNATTGISLGGFIGGNDATATFSAESTGNIINEGRITYSGKSKGATYMAGIIAYYNGGTFLPNHVKLINTGDIYCTGTNDSGTNTFSGIMGTGVSEVDDVQCFCTIYAPYHGVDSGNRKAAVYAMICKNPRTAGKTLFRNAKVGGVIVKERDNVDDSDIRIKITSSNFFEYLYGTMPDWSSITPEYDGCTVISSKDQIDYSEKEAPAPAPAPEA